jgi:hypothetical protein
MIAELVDSSARGLRISDADVVRSVKSASIDESNWPDNGRSRLNDRRITARRGCVPWSESHPAFDYSCVPKPGIPAFSGVAPAMILRAAWL